MQWIKELPESKIFELLDPDSYVVASILGIEAFIKLLENSKDKITISKKALKNLRDYYILSHRDQPASKIISVLNISKQTYYNILRRIIKQKRRVK